MTREDVHEKCFERYYMSMEDYEKGMAVAKELLPREAVDAIIDCAVEEAVQRISQMTFARIDGMTGIPKAKARYVEKESEQE